MVNDGRQSTRIEKVLTNEALLHLQLVHSLPIDLYGERGIVSDFETGKELIVRVLPREGASPRRFVHLQAISKLRHKKICSLLHYGQERGNDYAVYEYSDGRRLVDLLEERGQLSLETFVPIASQVLMAVGHAHQQGTSTGPVYPEDVALLSQQGRASLVKVRNFGLSAVCGLGTVALTSGVRPFPRWEPELVPSPDADVFSLGLLFAHMLTRGGLRSTSVDEATATWKAKAEQVPLGLRALIDSCLHPDPVLRPADANAVMEALIDAVPGELFRLPREDGASASSTSISSSRIRRAPTQPVVLNPPRESAPVVSPAELSGEHRYSSRPSVAPSASLTPPPPTTKAPTIALVLVGLAAALSVATLLLSHSDSETEVDASVVPDNARSASGHGFTASKSAPSNPDEGPPVAVAADVSGLPAHAPSPSPKPIIPATIDSAQQNASGVPSNSEPVAPQKPARRNRAKRTSTKRRSPDDQRSGATPTSEPAQATVTPAKTAPNRAGGTLLGRTRTKGRPAEKSREVLLRRD